jgi:DNA-binding transcriptional regulator/RsmH inhibitor MraZ
MQHAELTREIVVVGVRDRLEIWDRGAWERGLAELEGSAENVAERLVRDAR